MRYFIYVTESMYQGLHGLHEQRVIEADSVDEVYEWGLDIGRDLIHSYSELEDIFTERYEENEDYEDTEDIIVDVWKIKDDVQINTYDLDYKAYYFGMKYFVQNFCEEI